jgi:hypothetical protein
VASILPPFQVLLAQVIQKGGNPATAGTLVNTVDTNGIRLRQAWKTGDAEATPIVPVNKRFAEPACRRRSTALPTPVPVIPGCIG